MILDALTRSALLFVSVPADWSESAVVLVGTLKCEGFRRVLFVAGVGTILGIVCGFWMFLVGNI